MGADPALRAAGWAGRGYVRLVRATARCRVAGGERLGNLGGAVVAFWHNRMLGALVAHRGSGVGVVISRSRDGELISRVAQAFGHRALRGSSSRGGAPALRAALEHLRRGGAVAFTPDGPRGPRYRVRPGAVYAARQAGCPVVPVGIAMAPKAEFSSWDRFQVPVPFGKVLLVYGQPLEVPPGEPLDRACEALRIALAAVTEEAERSLGACSP
ncbi:MAG: hypothetical protein Kow0092_18560 [Deferrisomatales bacterium]